MMKNGTKKSPLQQIELRPLLNLDSINEVCVFLFALYGFQWNEMSWFALHTWVNKNAPFIFMFYSSPVHY